MVLGQTPEVPFEEQPYVEYVSLGSLSERSAFQTPYYLVFHLQDRLERIQFLVKNPVVDGVEGLLEFQITHFLSCVTIRPTCYSVQGAKHLGCARTFVPNTMSLNRR